MITQVSQKGPKAAKKSSAGLEVELTLALGVCVMLQRSLDTKRGLVRSHKTRNGTERVT